MLEEIEAEFEFNYPSVYKQLYNDDMLDWMKGWNEPWTPERNWYTEIYPKLKNHPPLLLHNNDFQLLTLEDITDYLRSWPDYWDKQHKFIPFGKNGSGDLYAFYFNKAEGENVPVAFVWHDMDEANILAKNLNDFIFRQMIEITHYAKKKSAEEETEYKMNLDRMLHTHARYLNADKVNRIKNIYQLPINEYKYKSLGSGEEYSEYGMLDREEVTAAIKNNIDFDLLDYTFHYQLTT